MVKRIILPVVVVFALVQIAYPSPARSQKKPVQREETSCYSCHELIQSLKDGNKHASLPCSKCHSNLNEHLKDPDKAPETNLELSLCGQCHPFQYETLMAVNLKSKAKVDKSTTTSRSPTFDKLMMPHGFTKEHDEPRSHVFMMTDHMIVDRAYGGKFQLKSWREVTNPGKVWDVVIDTNKELPQTAKAGNSVCLLCKTTDAILKWPYMGDANPAIGSKKRRKSCSHLHGQKSISRTPWVASTATIPMQPNRGSCVTH